MRKDGEFFKLPDWGYSSGGSDINDRAEVAWRARDNSGNTIILLLRRVAPKGDFDHDCRIDFRDFAQFQYCFTGRDAGPPGGFLADCTRGDFDEDGDIDADDFARFLEVFSGPGMTVPGCEP